MSDILREIIEHKRVEVDRRRALTPVALLEESIYFRTPVASLKKYLTRTDRHGIIAEIKRRSPSKGTFQAEISVEALSIGYMQAGASALSVLTDEKHFGGSNDDLLAARRFNWCPILRKDFVVDDYQLIEARAIGADAILLIAAALEPEKLRSLARLAKALGLEVLLEVHTAEELEPVLCDEIDVVGVNSRDLRDFSVDLNRAVRVRDAIPSGFVTVAESGILSAQDAKRMKEAGFDGLLIGELFMKSGHPERTLRSFLKELDSLS